MQDLIIVSQITVAALDGDPMGSFPYLAAVIGLPLVDFLAGVVLDVPLLIVKRFPFLI